jgi:hypothetical protein
MLTCHKHYTIALFCGLSPPLDKSRTVVMVCDKHIKAVKEPWRRSSRYKALSQILQILLRMEKMAALCRLFALLGMLKGTTVSYMAGTIPKDSLEDPTPLVLASEHATDDDGAPVEGVSKEETLSIVTLSARTGACTDLSYPAHILKMLTDREHISTNPA